MGLTWLLGESHWISLWLALSPNVKMTHKPSSELPHLSQVLWTSLTYLHHCLSLQGAVTSCEWTPLWQLCSQDHLLSSFFMQCEEFLKLPPHTCGLQNSHSIFLPASLSPPLWPSPQHWYQTLRLSALGSQQKTRKTLLHFLLHPEFYDITHLTWAQKRMT